MIKYIVPLIITLLNSLIDCFNPPRCHYCLKSSDWEVIHHLITGVFPLPCCHLNPIIMINRSFIIMAHLKPKLLPPYNRSSWNYPQCKMFPHQSILCSCLYSLIGNFHFSYGLNYWHYCAHFSLSSFLIYLPHHFLLYMQWNSLLDWSNNDDKTLLKQLIC